MAGSVWTTHAQIRRHFPRDKRFDSRSAPTHRTQHRRRKLWGGFEPNRRADFVWRFRSCETIVTCLSSSTEKSSILSRMRPSKPVSSTTLYSINTTQSSSSTSRVRKISRAPPHWWPPRSRVISLPDRGVTAKDYDKYLTCTHGDLISACRNAIGVCWYDWIVMIRF